MRLTKCNAQVPKTMWNELGRNAERPVHPVKDIDPTLTCESSITAPAAANHLTINSATCMLSLCGLQIISGELRWISPSVWRAPVCR